LNLQDEKKLMRRVAGHHDLRLDGMLDLVIRARGCSVLDIGCNRGLVGFEMANNGATVVHGCDNYAEGIAVARHLFADLRNVEAQFECVDLTKGASALKPFGPTQYDITLMLATYHKLKRAMPERELVDLMVHFGNRTLRWFGWRGTSEKVNDNELEIQALDRVFRNCALKRVHTSYLSHTLGVAAIWERI
jgi:SAM-dependent methyltransferase